jgi:hypothetical protein
MHAEILHRDLSFVSGSGPNGSDPSVRTNEPDGLASAAGLTAWRPKIVFVIEAHRRKESSGTWPSASLMRKFPCGSAGSAWMPVLVIWIASAHDRFSPEAAKCVPFERSAWIH